MIEDVRKRLRSGEYSISLQVIKTFSKTQDSWYYNKQDQLAIVVGEKPFVYVVEERRTEAFFTKNLYSDLHRLLVGTYLLNGNWLGIHRFGLSMMQAALLSFLLAKSIE